MGILASSMWLIIICSFIIGFSFGVFRIKNKTKILNFSAYLLIFIIVISNILGLGFIELKAYDYLLIGYASFISGYAAYLLWILIIKKIKK